MRILVVVHQFYPEFSGGTERVTLNLARMLQRAGHYIHVLACTVDPDKSGGHRRPDSTSSWLDAVHQGVPVTLVPRSELPETADISLDTEAHRVDQFAEWIEAQRFDLAHVMHTMRMGSAVLAIQRCGLPYVMTLTDFFLPCAQINLVDLKNRICSGPQEGKRCAQECLTLPWTEESYAVRYAQARSLLQAAAERVAPSGYVAARYRESFPGLDVRVIGHGIDLLALGSAAGLIPAESSGARLKLAYVGSIVPQKGLDVLLKALAMVPSRDVSLKIIGGFYGDSPYHSQIRALVAADDRVQLAGSMDAAGVFATLGGVDLLCLPSRVPESYSLVLHEACAAGVPALVSDAGAPADHVTVHGGGRVVALDDVSAWAEAINAVQASPDLLKQWKAELPLPQRVEEEAFFYESLYRRLPKPQAK